MTHPGVAVSASPSTGELQVELERLLGEHWGASCHIASITRRPSAYRTSFALEELDVILHDGTMLQLIRKDTSHRSLTERARRAKPAFLADPRREIETYRRILTLSGLDTAICYGTVIDPAANRYWLFLERVPGVELYQVGDHSLWEDAARWLAGFHTRFADEAVRSAARSRAPLLVYDRYYYRLWPRRALEFAQHWPIGDRQRITWLGERYESAVDRLFALPTTVIHGEFYASNVLVQETEGGKRVCPVDWEMAAVGPGLIDLAALIAGNWSANERRSFAAAYDEALPARGERPTLDELLVDLEFCRLHLAVQWLGWAEDWIPPREHAHDWLADAVSIAEELRL
jgi:hypothetical protein